MFQVEDPLKRLVILTRKTWNVHIIPYHTEVYGQEAYIKRVIENPAYILKDRDNEDKENYFDLCNLPNDGSLSIIKIVVDFKSGTGDVNTAYSNKSLFTQATTGRGVIYVRDTK